MVLYCLQRLPFQEREEVQGSSVTCPNPSACCKRQSWDVSLRLQATLTGLRRVGCFRGTRQWQMAPLLTSPGSVCFSFITSPFSFCFSFLSIGLHSDNRLGTTLRETRPRDWEAGRSTESGTRWPRLNPSSAEDGAYLCLSFLICLK